MPINYNFDRNNLTYQLVAFNGEAVLESADLYALDGIWIK
jgi:levanase/fructan beta-fructosidase